VDGDGNLVNLCSFNVTVSDEFCAPQIQFFVGPITRMVVAGVDHASTVDATAPAHEFFLDVEVPMNAAASYPISLEGYTGGENVNFFTAFVDFDQDGVFNNAEEMFEIGSLENSTGLDGQAASGTISVPLDARSFPCRSLLQLLLRPGGGLHGDHLRDRHRCQRKRGADRRPLPQPG
jgi:hypothetical protein